MDPSQVEDRLLWLESRAITCAREVRRLRSRIRSRPFMSRDAVLRRMAKLDIELRSREDEVRMWERWTWSRWLRALVFWR
jgi:hypothetical protein